jgi:hypothetical protein
LFVSASSSRLTLARPAFAASLAGLLRAIFAWAPGSPPTGKTDPTPRNSILPLTWSSCSPQPALCYRPLLALSLCLAAKTVTSLEPRTPHQSEKLKKLSKNDCVFTPSIFRVNGKSLAVTTFIFNRVQPVHRGMTGYCAKGPQIFPARGMSLCFCCIDWWESI